MVRIPPGGVGSAHAVDRRRRMLAWKAYQTQLPTVAEIASWADQCPTSNIAVITGAASRNCIALDIDVGDERLSWAIEKLAVEILGETPLRRVGRPPRLLMVYRCDAPLRKMSVRLESGDGVELLANGAPFTAYGKHWAIGKYFNWLKYDLIARGPEHAPLVTAEQIETFWRRLTAEYGA